MDFEIIGNRLAASGRHVLAMDYRGRGYSGHDPDWKRYDLMVELDDVMAMLSAFGLSRAIFLGTSRGGLLSMLSAVTRPTALAGVILNDIGAVIDAQGLARIRGYVGKIPQPQSYEGGVEALKRVFGQHFPAESDDSWLRFAQRVWKDADGKLVARFDNALMKTLADIDLEKQIPTLWPQFDALKPVPLLVIRGENSDLLSQHTAEEMVERHQEGEFKQLARLHLTADQGHAPLLEDEPTIRAILDFVAVVNPPR